MPAFIVTAIVYVPETAEIRIEADTPEKAVAAVEEMGPGDIDDWAEGEGESINFAVTQVERLIPSSRETVWVRP